MGMENAWTLIEARVVYTGGETSDWPDNVVDLLDPEQLKTWISNTTGDLPCGMEQEETLTFKVNKPIKNLRRRSVTSKFGVPVNRSEVVMGDFEPQEEAYKFSYPKDKIPDNPLARGKYGVHTTFLCDPSDAPNNEKPMKPLTILERKSKFRIIKV